MGGGLQERKLRENEKVDLGVNPNKRGLVLLST